MKIIVDIDGTIADCRHRIHLVKDGRKEWKKFFDLMHEDLPIQPVIRLVNAMFNANSDILYVTGRPEEYRAATTNWFQDNTVHCNDILMRKTGDFRPDYIIKEEILFQQQGIGFWPDLVIDDNQVVVDMWRKHGIITLQNSMRELP